MIDWNQRYLDDQTGWDIGHISTPLKEYIDQIEDKTISILIPGAGNAYEAAYLHQSGYSDVTVIDIAETPLERFNERHPDFPEDQLIHGDFFSHQGLYDLILEQTFFCAIPPSMREEYVKQMHHLLKPEGRLVGVLFGVNFEREGPPFGGSQEEYIDRFTPYFNVDKMEVAYNSIAPRQGSELFINLTPK